MLLQQRIDLLVRLGEYITDNSEEWQEIKEKAYRVNAWFIPEFIELSLKNITEKFLDRSILENFVADYKIPQKQESIKKVGIVMAGNIPLVGFQDFLMVFISGHAMVIKASSKDEVLIKHLANKLSEWEPTTQRLISFEEMLKGCDAYIATGSNNSGRYFDYYFGRYPNLIRKNRTSVAVIDGTEIKEDLELLADDMQLFFGLGCRNVTQLYVPKGYDFIPLLTALKKYDHYLDYHKYKNNFDYHLTISIMNGRIYMNSGAVILMESDGLFSPVSQVNYSFYEDKETLLQSFEGNEDIQCVVGNGLIPFGQAQQPGLTDYADGADTMQFLSGL